MTKAKTAINIIDAISDPQLFKPWFDGLTWNAWRTFLKVLFALQLDGDQAVTYTKHTKRSTAPHKAFNEAWLVVGRRGGKSLVASLVAVFLAAFRDYARCLKPGEIGTIMILAADRRQARTIMRYAKGFFELPMLKRLVINETAESIELSTRVVIEIHTASFRSVRGYTLLAVICDELAFWRSDESANPDSEIIGAVRPGLATIPDSLLLCISSPYARRGALWTAYDRHFGKDSNVLVWQADSKSMNPSLDDSVIAQAYEEDPASAAAEYGGLFRTDVESFISREAVAQCLVSGRLELPPASDISYGSFVDPSGGSSDSMTLAISHVEKDRVVLDAVREIKAPFSPESAVKEFADLLKTYRVSSVTGDRYGGEWPREQFRKHGIGYTISDKTKSEIYLSCLPLLNSSRVELLDNPRLLAQLLGLERRTSRGGRDSIDHSPHSNSHDDLINAAAGALVLAQAGGYQKPGQWRFDDGGIWFAPQGCSSRADVAALKKHEERVRRYFQAPSEIEAATLFASNHPERNRATASWAKKLER